MRAMTLLTVTLVVGLLSGCSASIPELDLLRADPMATATPAGLNSQSVSENAGGTTLGIDTPSYVLRRLHLADPAAALVELDNVAQDAGWATRVQLDLTATPVVALYRRTSDGRLLELGMTWDGADKVILDLSTP
jgi:uncharacterized protein YceK